MREPRLFVDIPLAANQIVQLPPASTHYVGRVLRLRRGADLRLFNDSGLEYAGVLLEISATGARVRIDAALSSQIESALRITLVQGLCRGQRMDYCIQKATELGVERIVPLQTQHSVVRLHGNQAKKRVQHWRAIAVSACEQSGRTRVPVVEQPLDLESFLARERNDTLAVLDREGVASEDWRHAGESLTIVIGPEGGLSDTEHEQMMTAGAQRWRLGPRTLRTETAGLVALALAQGKWGDLS